MDNQFPQPRVMADGMPGAFMASLLSIWNFGATVKVRGMVTKELTNQLVRVSEPWKRCIMIPGRHDSIVAKCAETLWMLSGRSDIEWLSRYIPQAPKYSDDGVNWRGAYGPRLRAWPSRRNGAIDQLAYVIDLLKSDPTTRQAVMSIWDPDVDTLPGKDIPCNNWIQFLVRDGRLDMSVAQRSSDVWWGFSGIDTFQWSIVQQLMSGWLDVDMGVYTHFIGSFHLYDRHFPSAGKVLTDPYKAYYHTMDLPIVLSSVDFDDFDCQLEDLMALEMVFRRQIDNDSTLEQLDDTWRATGLFDPLLATMTRIAMLGLLKDYEPVATWMDAMPVTDMWVAALEWLCRKSPALLDTISQVTPKIYEYVWDYMLGDVVW